MSTLANKIQPNLIRRWIRLRPDLVFIEADRSGEKQWVVKDPIALKYFRLRDDEALVLKLSDGDRSPDSIAKQYNEKFMPRRVSARDVQQLWYAFFREGLVVSDHPGQVKSLDDRASKQAQQRRILSMVYWPFLRLPGVSPDRWLSWLKPTMDRLLRLPFAAAVSLLVALGGLVLVINLAKFYNELPGIDRWFTLSTIALVAICLSLSKVLHELGHAVVCKRFGGECHEIGILLMLGVPALYCDLSDSWCIPERWKRFLIGAAGMLTESIIGAIAVLVWVSTHAGTVHSLAHHLVLICFLGTVLVNANPLLRYDGYFMLSDWLNIPNLADEARLRLRTFWMRILGRPSHVYLPDRTWKMRFGLIFYSIASSVYSWILLVSVLWVVVLAFRDWGLESVGISIVGGTVLAASTLNVAKRVQRTIDSRGTRSHGFPIQAVMVYCVLGSIILAVLLFPIPHNVVAPTLIQAKGLRPVTTTTQGTMRSSLPYGSVVLAGEVVTELESFLIEADLQQAKQQQGLQIATIASLEASIAAQPQLADQLPAAKLTLQSINERIEGIERRRQGLTIQAKQTGRWIEPLEAKSADRSKRNTFANARLEEWNGLPCATNNRGADSNPGTILGWIGDAEFVEAVAVVPEDQVEWVQVGQRADLYLDAYPSCGLPGKVESISLLPTQELSPRLVASGKLPMAYADGSLNNSESPLYSIRIRLDVDKWMLSAGDRRILNEMTKVDGITAQSKVRIPASSIGYRIWRWLAQQLRLV